MPTNIPSADNPLWAPVPHYQQPSEDLLRLLQSARQSMADAVSGADVSCRACGSCCDFPRQDHVLFATKLELDAAIYWSRQHLQLSSRAAAELLTNGLCPFWQSGRCAVHEVRPLGCRSFFCTGQEKKLVASKADNVISYLRSNIKGHNAFRWYGPAITYCLVNVIHFSD